MSIGTGGQREAGQHARAQARARSWKRFFGASFKRDFETWSQGAKGEEIVGTVLASLIDEGWYAIHDVCFGRGNIDHVLIGPGGIFAIETKSHRGRIPIDRLDLKMLGQAYSEKKTLETITGMPVQSLLVFSQAYLVGSVPARRRGVTVLPARMLAGFLSRRRPTMSADEARAIRDRLAFAVGQAGGASS
jgi:Nuclease-related domain